MILACGQHYHATKVFAKWWFFFVCFHYSFYIISKSYPFLLFGQLLISTYGLCSITIIIFLLIPRLAIKNFLMSDPVSFVALICVVFQGIYFLATQDIPHLSCTFDTPALASVISPRSSGSFYWRLVFGNQNTGTRCACCSCGVLCLVFLTEQTSKYMYIYGLSVSGFCVFFVVVVYCFNI